MDVSTARVAVVMGSDSDWETMQRTVTQLRALGLEARVEVMSAHRCPERVAAFARSAHNDGIDVIIAAAGMAAHLAGAVAANTTLPVIGVPIASGPLQGIDALLSTVQMPPGVPVATVGIGKAGATNAAILAAQIIAAHDADVRTAIESFKTEQAAGVDTKNAALQERLRDEC